MRILLSILFLSTSFSLFAQVQFVRPLEPNASVNKVFPQFHHQFKANKNILHTTAKDGQIEKVTPNSFTYYMPYKVSKGATWIYFDYKKAGNLIHDSLHISFIPEGNYTATLVNDLGQKVNIDDLKKGNYSFQIYNQKQLIQASVYCFNCIHIPKRGEMPGPIRCCNWNAQDALAINKKCTQRLNIKPGDRVIFEDIKFKYLGEVRKVKKGISILF